MMEAMERHKPKILLYTDTKQLGGAENHMLSLFKFYDRMKVELQLACPADPSLDPWCKKIDDMTVRIHRLNIAHKHDPRHYTQLKKIIQEEGIDLIHVHVWNPASGRYGFLAAQKMHIPYILTEHDPFKLSPFKDWIKKKLIADAAHIIAISEKNHELLAQLYPLLKSRISTIHNGIDTTWFESQLLSFSKSDEQEYRKNIFETDGETPIITCIAELHPRKGIIYALEAMKHFAEKEEKIKLVIVGSGEEKTIYEKYIKENNLKDYVILLGRRHDIPQILRASDVFILPSLNEAFGLVLLEAMMAKLPIIATNNGGIPEIIKDGENGLLIAPKNTQAIIEAIKKLTTLPDLVRKMSEKNYQDVKKKFDVKDMVKKTEEVYDLILSHSSRNIAQS